MRIVGHAQSCPDLTPSRDPKKYPKIIFINETQFEAKSAKKTQHARKPHSNQLKRKYMTV